MAAARSRSPGASLPACFRSARRPTATSCRRRRSSGSQLVQAPPCRYSRATPRRNSTSPPAGAPATSIRPCCWTPWPPRGLPPAAARDHVPQGSGLSAPALLGQALTDRTFRIPIVRAGEARFGAAASTYPYEFRWPAPGPGGLLGAGHCVDLPFVFDLLDAEGVATVADHDPPPGLADRGVQDDPLRDVRGIWAGVI